MRRTPASALVAGLTAALGLAAAAPALAEPTSPLAPTLPYDVSYSATDNVEYLGRFPEHFGTAGGAVGDGVFYVTDPRGVYTYDTSTPSDPQLLDSLALYQTAAGTALAQEDVDTNGQILLVDAATAPGATGSQLRVVDVRDPNNLTLLASVPVTDHTWTCITGTDDTGAQNGCAFAYGRSGAVVDLTNPAEPALLDTTWRAAVGYGDRGNSPYTHDVTEIRPGLVMTAGATAVLMDTTDPTKPVYLTEIGERDRFSSLGYHSVEWARGGDDHFVVLGTEIAPAAAPGMPSATENTAGSDCSGENSVVETWDAREVKDALERYETSRDPAEFRDVAFTRVDTYDASGRGLFLDGKAPASQLYCAHWMDLRPDFKNGGVMAVGYYNRGTRFVEVDDKGAMSEIGWLTPADGYAGSPQWVGSDAEGDVVYVMDYRRGLEVLRLEPEAATGVVSQAPDLIAPASAMRLGRLEQHGGQLAAGGAAALLLVLVAVTRTARRRAPAVA